MKILYLHPIGSFGGASRSLLELLRALSSGFSVIQPHVVTPQGRVATILDSEAIPVLTAYGLPQFDNTFVSYYRGLRWLILMRELAFLLPTFIALQTAKQKWADVDIIHANEITAIPAAIMAKCIFAAPLVVHVRSVQRAMTEGLRGRLLKYLIRRYVDQLVAIDCTVRESLPSELSVEIVRNGFPLPDIPRARSDQGSYRRFSPDNRLRVGCVGVLLKVKGVYEFVESARLCIQAGREVEFIIVGENRRNLPGIKGYLLKRFGFSEDVRADLESLINKYGLRDRVKIIDFTTDVKAIYDTIDLLCFPSHLNACGRSVFEAAFSRVPSIVAVENPFEDTIVDGQTGICIRARDPMAIADAVTFFYLNPKELARMGEAAFQLAKKNFDIAANAVKMVDIYERLLINCSSRKAKS